MHFQPHTTSLPWHPERGWWRLQWLDQETETTITPTMRRPLSAPSGTRRRQECEACENYRLAASRHGKAASVSCPQLLHRWWVRGAGGRGRGRERGGGGGETDYTLFLFGDVCPTSEDIKSRIIISTVKILTQRGPIDSRICRCCSYCC